VVSARAYQPDRGDFIFLDFSPQAGTEQAGRRPALVLSPRSFNIATGLILACSITNQVKGGSFEVPVPSRSKLTGVVLSDHVRSLDWLARRAEFHSKAADAVVEEVVARLLAIVSAHA
jgi:mRNA interferase MazF